MSAESKKKRGESGVANAKANPYRYQGGDYDHPVLMDPRAREALRSQPSDYKNTATYANGLMGGVLAAKLGFEGGFQNWKELINN